VFIRVIAIVIDTPLKSGQIRCLTGAQHLEMEMGPSVIGYYN